jgi:RNA 2',3'-cyclic 3'-phosphodiesterase
VAAKRAKLLGPDQLAEASSEPDRSQIGKDSPVRIRAFFGLPLPEAQRSNLVRYLADCAGRAPQFRWTPDANLHLTLRFLGHVEEVVAEQIAERVADAGLQGFELQLGEVGTFKRGSLVRVVWLGLAAGGTAAKHVAAVVESACVVAGLEAETRAFSPHLTLARARAHQGARLPELPPSPRVEAWHADELILYRSILGRAGAVYETLRTISLR